MHETTRNQRVAERLSRDLRWHDQVFEEGQCVALLDGKIIAVAIDLDSALRALRCIDSDPNRGMIVELVQPMPDVIRRQKDAHRLLSVSARR